MTMGIQFTSMREHHWSGAPPFSNENSSFEFYTFATVLPHQNPPDHGWLTGSSPARGRRWWVWMVRLGQHWNSCSGPQPHTQRLPHDDGDPVHFNAGASLEWCTTFQQREFKPWILHFCYNYAPPYPRDHRWLTGFPRTSPFRGNDSGGGSGRVMKNCWACGSGSTAP